MVSQIETLQSEYGVPVATLVDMARISLPSYMRWKRRIHDGREPVEKPGAKKVAPIDLDALQQRIKDLPHGRKRTAGTGPVYDDCRDGISRREFADMVKEVRTDQNKDKAAGQCQVQWLRPDLAWAMDGLEYRGCRVLNIQDLCSRYKFSPLTSTYEPCGEEIAGHLSRHFERFGPPLFIKRDNAGNLNHGSVNDVLEEYMVIPINSPYYTPGYNGAIEHSQGELKAWMDTWKHAAGTDNELALQADNAAHAWNHRSRRSLSGKNACRTYFSSTRLRYDKRQRKEVYDWIFNLAIDISEKAGKNEIDPTAWRVSARKWMERNRMIVIRKPQNVLPDFFSKNCHN
jgi:hypothetical protein